MTDAPTAWVIGAGGLVGGAVSAALDDPFTSPGLPWDDPALLTSAFRDQVREFSSLASAAGGWVVHWAAGAGVVASGGAVLDREAVSLEIFLGALEQTRPPGPGCIVLASSAGAVYAGCGSGPFTESTTPVPLSGYGESKLAQEAQVAAASDRIGAPVLIARIANVYGQRQDVSKPQGLISHLCRSAVTGSPLNLYVPLDTLRHYVFASDVGVLMREAGLRAWREQAPVASIKIISGGPPVTVGQVVNVVRRIARHPLRVSFGAEPTGALQPSDLRLRSEVWTDLDRDCGRTDLVAGVKRVYDATFGEFIRIAK